MNKSILRFGLAGLLAIAIAAIPVALQAQTNTLPPLKKLGSHVVPFRGKLKAVDNTAKTISIGNETIQITSETKITKAGKPATLEDGVVDDMVSGAYHKEADGKLNAVSLRFLPKPQTAPPTGESKTNKTHKAMTP